MLLAQISSRWSHAAGGRHGELPSCLPYAPSSAGAARAQQLSRTVPCSGPCFTVQFPSPSRNPSGCPVVVYRVSETFTMRDVAPCFADGSRRNAKLACEPSGITTDPLGQGRSTT